MKKRVTKVERPTLAKKHQNCSLEELEEDAINQSIIKEQLEKQIDYNNQNALNGILLLTAGTIITSHNNFRKVGLSVATLGGIIAVPEILKNIRLKKDVLMLEREICNIKKYLDYAKKNNLKKVEKQVQPKEEFKLFQRELSPEDEKFFERMKQFK